MDRTYGKFLKFVATGSIVVGISVSGNWVADRPASDFSMFFDVLKRIPGFRREQYIFVDDRASNVNKSLLFGFTGLFCDGADATYLARILRRIGVI